MTKPATQAEHLTRMSAMTRPLPLTPPMPCAVGLALLEARLDQPDAQGMVKPGFCPVEWLDDPTNLLLTENGDDIVMLEGNGQGVYNLHWLLASRGKKALASAERLLGRAFTQHNARVVFGWTPVHLRAARWFNRKIGGTSLGVVETEWGPMEGFYLTREQYEAKYVIPSR